MVTEPVWAQMLRDYSPYLMGVVAALVIVGMVIGALVMRWRTKTARSRWLAGVYGVWTGADDSASWDRARAVNSLRNWYGVESTHDLDNQIEELLRGQTGSVGWDVGRAADLLRIGVAAGYYSEDDCLEKASTLAERLRGIYGSWEEYAAGFEQGMNAWQHRRNVTDPEQLGLVRRNLPHLRGSVWPKVSWDTSL